MLTVTLVGMDREQGHPPDGSGAEGGGGAGGDVRVVLGVQLVIDGILRTQSHEPGVSKEPGTAPAPTAPLEGCAQDSPPELLRSRC